MLYSVEACHVPIPAGWGSIGIRMTSPNNRISKEHQPMKAVGIVHYLPVENENAFTDFETDKPVPRGRDVLVAVRAIAVNPVDTKVRGGRGKEGVVEDPPRIIGWDASGIVEAVGPDAALFAPGDAVYYAGDITRSGTNAEFHLVG